MKFIKNLINLFYLLNSPVEVIQLQTKDLSFQHKTNYSQPLIEVILVEDLTQFSLHLLWKILRKYKIRYFQDRVVVKVKRVLVLVIRNWKISKL